jgi:hypothetical protein
LSRELNKTVGKCICGMFEACNFGVQRLKVQTYTFLTFKGVLSCKKIMHTLVYYVYIYIIGRAIGCRN